MAGRIPSEFIDEMLNRVDIVELIDQRVPLKKAGKDYKACCPFHNEKTPSFTVSSEKQFYHCFGCGAGGGALNFLMEYERLDFVEAVQEIAALLGVEVPREQGSAEPLHQHDDLFAVLEQASQFYKQQLRQHSQAEVATDYLKGRGLSGEIAAEFVLGYAPPGWDNLSKTLNPEQQEHAIVAGLLVRKDNGQLYDRFRDRVMFPIRDGRGRLIGFGGRVIGNDEPKYLNSPETPVFHKGRELYGLHEMRRARVKADTILVVEGYMDVLALVQHGVRNVVATLGTATTREHLERLFRVSNDIIFCFDGDDAGRKAAGKALDESLSLLREGRSAHFLFMPDGEDPDSLIRSQGADVFQQRQNWRGLSEFLFDRAEDGLDLQRLDDRARLVERVSPLISKIPMGAFRQILQQRLAELSHMDVAELQRLSDTRPAPPSQAVAVNTGRSRKPRKQTRTLMREGITWLLLQPVLANQVVEPQRLRILSLAGIDLFVDMLECIQRQPKISTGGLLDNWAEHQEGQHLKALLANERFDDEENAEKRFSDLIGKLESQLKNQRFNELFARLSSLSEQERQELQQLKREK